MAREISNNSYKDGLALAIDNQNILLAKVKPSKSHCGALIFKDGSIIEINENNVSHNVIEPKKIISLEFSDNGSILIKDKNEAYLINEFGLLTEHKTNHIFNYNNAKKIIESIGVNRELLIEAISSNINKNNLDKKNKKEHTSFLKKILRKK